MSISSTGKENIKIRKFSQEIEKEICRLYVDNNRSIYSLKNQFNCYSTVIRDCLIRNKIPLRINQYSHRGINNKYNQNIEEEICNKYLYRLLSIAQLAEEYNCAKTTIRSILIRHNVNLKRG
jgi:transposase-like protein